MNQEKEMPIRGQAKCPKFEGEPRTLLRFWDDMDLVRGKCTNQPDDAEMKKYAIRYTPVPISDLWAQLPEYSNAAKTWEDFKKAVTALYPEAEESRKWAIRDLDYLVDLTRRSGISSVYELGDYTRKFQAIALFLQTKNRLSEGEAARSYRKGFSDNLWQRMATRLAIKFPDRDVDDPWKVTEYYEAASYVLGNSTDSQWLEGMGKTIKQEPQTKTEDIGAIITSSMNQFLKALAPALTTAQASGSRNPSAAVYTQAVSSQPFDRFCFGCLKRNCTLRYCPDIGPLLEEGKIIRENRNGRTWLVYPDGSSIFRPKGKGIVQVVREHYEAKARQEAPAKSAYLVEVSQNDVNSNWNDVEKAVFVSEIVTEETKPEPEVEPGFEALPYDDYDVFEEIQDCQERIQVLQNQLR